MFVDYEDYIKYGSGVLSEDDAYYFLNKSERQINTLCQNRISDDSILEYMSSTQNLVKEIICDHAEFLFKKKDEIENGTISRYSNNGASVTYKNTSYSTIGGFVIANDLYSELVSTGLCYRGM